MSRDSSWDYQNPVRIVFGCGRVREVSALSSGRALLVTYPGMTVRDTTARVRALLGAERTVVFDSVTSNPDINTVEQAVAALRHESIDTVVALGGGSVVDVAKALRVALVPRAPSLRDAIESGDRLDDIQALDLIAIPTTAGTGSEVTPFATLWDSARRRKLSLTSPTLFPKVALLDPELTLSLPWEVTLASGLDAFSQCFEAIWNRHATPITTALAQRGLAIVPGALRRLKADPGSLVARSAMLEAGLLSGLSIARTRTALAHSISYPITAHLGLPHGLACSFSLPGVLAFNLESDDGRLAELAARAGREDGQGLVRAVVELFRDLGVPAAVRKHVPDYAALYALVPEMLTPGRADNNLRPPSFAAIRQILATTEDWLFRT